MMTMTMRMQQQKDRKKKRENNNEQKVLNKILEYGIVKWKNGQVSKRKERRKKVKTWDKAQ